ALAAIIDKRACVSWMCVPRMDGDPIFCSLLGPNGDHLEGGWSFRLADQEKCEQKYLRNTAILETVLTDANGNQVKIIDFAPRFQMGGRIFRGQTLVRIVEPLSGTPLMTVSMKPRYNYGSSLPETT